MRCVLLCASLWGAIQTSYGNVPSVPDFLEGWLTVAVFGIGFLDSKTTATAPRFGVFKCVGT